MRELKSSPNSLILGITKSSNSKQNILDIQGVLFIVVIQRIPYSAGQSESLWRGVSATFGLFWRYE